MQDFLRQEDKADCSKVLQNAKENGNMKLSICTDSLRYFDIRPEDLIPEFDEMQTAESFWKAAILPTNQVLKF